MSLIAVGTVVNVVEEGKHGVDACDDPVVVEAALDKGEDDDAAAG